MRLLWPRSLWMLGSHVSSHPILLIGTCFEGTTLEFALHHFSPLSFLLGHLSSRTKPSKWTPLLSIQVDSLHVFIFVVFMFKKHITVFTLEALLVSEFDVVQKILCRFEHPPAVPNSAEEGSENAVLAMSPHVGTVHCLILTHSTWELLWSCVAVLLVSCLTWNRYLIQCWHFIILWFFWWLSKILLFLVEKLPSVTSLFVTFTRISWTLAYSFTRAGRGNWMTIHVRAGQDICLDVNSLL